MSKRAHILCINTTQDLDSASAVEFMYDHLVSVNRPCAIVKRELPKYQKNKQTVAGLKETKYSVWRTIDDADQDHYRDLTVLEKIGRFEVVKEFGNFEQIARG